MIEIYSKVKTDKLLHTVFRLDDVSGHRVDFTSEDKYLQGAVICMDAGKEYSPHRHIKCERHTDITQEAWVVFRGSVEVTFYDVDDAVLLTETIRAGDCSITFGGGHSFNGGSDDTLVYEFKSGPYYGRDADKEWID